MYSRSRFKLRRDYYMIKTLFFFFFSGILMANAAAQSSTTDPAYAKKLEELYSHTVDLIQPKDLAEAMKTEKVYILDTRASSEYNTSHLKGARFINYATFRTSEVSDIPKNAKVIVYCSVGWRSEKIGEKLKKKGYTKVYNLYGGIFEWVNQGYKVYNTAGETKVVHAYSKEWAKWIK